MDCKKTGSSITIGIVSYNTASEILAQTLLSIRKSTITSDVMLLCNSADDKYQEDVKTLGNEYGCHMFLNQPNKGFGHAHNYLAGFVETRWYACCNPDIRLEPSCLELLINAISTKSGIALLAPTLVDQFGERQITNRPFLTPKSVFQRYFFTQNDQLSLEPNDTGLVPAEFISGAFFLASIELWSKLEGFDEKFFLYCEDADLSIRASKLGNNYIHPGATAVHLWERESHRNIGTWIKHITSLIRYFTKHNFRITRMTIRGWLP